MIALIEATDVRLLRQEWLACMFAHLMLILEHVEKLTLTLLMLIAFSHAALLLHPHVGGLPPSLPTQISSKAQRLSD